jgi:hypothetical protein
MGYGQFLAKDEASVILSMEDASRVAYWGMKGIESKTYVPVLELNIELLEKTLQLQEQVNFNLKNAMEEYRAQLAKTATRNNELQQDIMKVMYEKDKLRDKNDKLTRILIAGGIALATMTYISFR